MIRQRLTQHKIEKKGVQVKKKVFVIILFYIKLEFYPEVLLFTSVIH